MKLLSRRLLVSLAALWSMGVQAGDADFTLINKTGYEIESVFVAPSKSRTWGSDVLKDGTMPNGRKVPITFSKNSNVCVYDMLVHWVGYGRDEDSTWERLDLCAVHTISLFYDRKANVTTAELD